MLQTASGLEDLIPARSPVRMKLALPQKPYIVLTLPGKVSPLRIMALMREHGIRIRISMKGRQKQDGKKERVRFPSRTIPIRMSMLQPLMKRQRDLRQRIWNSVKMISLSVLQTMVKMEELVLL